MFSESLSTKLSEIPSFQKLLLVQELLTDLSEENIEETAKKIKILELDMKSLATNLYRVTMVYDLKSHLYYRLISKILGIFEIDIEKLFYFMDNDSHKKVIRYMSMGEVEFLESFCVKCCCNKYKKILPILRNDDVDSLIQLAANPEFDYSAYKGNLFSHYYKFGLIELSAHFGAIKCFKYILFNDTSNAIEQEIFDRAISGGNCEIIHILEQKGLKPDKRSIKCAIKYHQRDIYDWLMENNNYQIDLKYCIQHCFAHGIKDYSVKFIRDNATFDVFIRRLLEIDRYGGKHYAIPFLEMMEIFFKHSKFKPEFLNYALEYGFLDLAIIFLKSPKVNVNNQYNFHNELCQDIYDLPIALAIKYNYFEIFKILFNHPKINFGFDQSEGLNRLFMLSIYHKSEEITIYMIKNASIDINNQDDSFDIDEECMVTPLILAARYNLTSITKLLLEQERIKINYHNDITSAFIEACKTGNHELIELFIQNPKFSVIGLKKIFKKAARLIPKCTLKYVYSKYPELRR